MPPRALLRCLLAAALLTSVAAAQKSWQVPAVNVAHRNGQTFVTWSEVSATPVPDAYAVWASAKAIQSSQDLQQATLLGVVPKGSATCPRSGTNYVLESTKPALTAGTGFFVATPAAKGTRYFAVTARRGTSENTWVGTNANASPGVAETPGPSAPVLQWSSANGGDSLWAHFVGAGGAGPDPAMGNAEGAAFVYRVYYDPTRQGPRPLVVVLHPRGGSYKTIQPLPFAPKEAVQLFLDDPLTAPGHSMWFGYHEGFGSAAPSGKVVPYTENRVLWSVDKLLADQALAIDQARVYAVGASLGAIGSFGLGVRHADRFAAVGGIDPAFDVAHADFALKGEVATLFGTATQNLPTTLGPRFYDLEAFARNAPALAGAGIAPMRWFFGRADTVTGWTDKPAALRAARDAGLPLVSCWDLRSHGVTGAWSTLEAPLLAELFELRLDRALPCFHGLSLDDDPGNGSPLNGVPVGTMGGYLRFDPASVVETSAGVDFDFGLRSDAKRLDAAPAAWGTVDLVMRRLQQLKPSPGALFEVRVTRKGQAAVLESRVVRVATDGLLRVPGLEAETTERSLSIHAYTPVLPELRVDGSARLGGELRFTLLTNANDIGALFVGSQQVSWPTPFGTWQIGDLLYLWAGPTGPNGLVEVRVPVPLDTRLDKGTLLAQALTGTGTLAGTKVTKLATATFWQ
ncbi:MAG: hypothetical protein R3F30_03475 [Planctomycetota bacterium]